VILRLITLTLGWDKYVFEGACTDEQKQTNVEKDTVPKVTEPSWGQDTTRVTEALEQSCCCP